MREGSNGTPSQGDWVALAQGQVTLQGIRRELHALYRVGHLEHGLWGHTAGADAAKEDVVRRARHDGVRAWYDAGDGASVWLADHSQGE